MAELPKGFGGDRVRQMPQNTADFVDHIFNRVVDTEVVDTPKFIARSPSAKLDEKIWTSGHRGKNGVWVMGHYCERVAQ